MKKTIITSLFAFSIFLTNAQLKVYSGGNIYVGGLTTTPNSVLSVGGAGNSLYEMYVQSLSSSNYGTGCYVQGPAAVSGSNAAGVSARDSTSSAGLGGYARGVVGVAYTTSALSVGRHYGVYGEAGNASSGYNYGVYGYIIGSHNGAGVFGTTSADYSIPGKYAGFFNGDIRMTTDNATKTSTNTWAVSSDARLKKNITPFTDGLNVIRNIKPVRFQFTGIGGLPTKDTNIGVLAQDVQKVAPYCIGTTKLIMKQSDASAFSSDIVATFNDTTGTPMVMVNSLTMNTHGLFYAMLNSIKQLDSTVSSLQKQLNQCCGSSIKRAIKNDTTGQADSATTLQVQLANNNDMVLYQNVPNPFNGSTEIRYFIPQNTTGDIYISFSDMYGTEIKKVEITNTGFGKIEAGTENLVNGIYSYSLVVDGKVIDSKKMIKNR